jgi:hypothetical protein
MPEGIVLIDEKTGTVALANSEVKRLLKVETHEQKDSSFNQDNFKARLFSECNNFTG